MLAGSAVNQMNADPAGTYAAGETWFEGPGCHHVRSENVSGEDGGGGKGQDAKFYAVIIVDDEVLEKNGVEGVFVLDAAVEEEKQKGERERK